MTPLIRITLNALLFCVYVRSQTESEQVTEYSSDSIPGPVVDYEQTSDGYNGEFVPGQVTDFQESPNSYNGESVQGQFMDFQETPNSYNGESVPGEVTDFEQIFSGYSGDFGQGLMPDSEQGTGELVPEQVTDVQLTPNYYNDESVPGQVTDFEQTPNSYSSDFAPEQATDFAVIYNGEPAPEQVAEFDQTSNDYIGESVPGQVTDTEQFPVSSNGESVPGQVTDFEQIPSGYSGESEQATENTPSDRTGETAPGQVTGFDQIPNGYNGLDTRPGFSVVRPPGFALPPGLASLPRPPVLPVPVSIPRPPIPAAPLVPVTIPRPTIPAAPLVPVTIPLATIPPVLPPILQATVPRLPAGFVCVPIGTCPAPINNGIDIRIVTPGDVSPCPPGQVPCNTGSSSQCGLRFVTNVNTEDGPATQGAYPWQVYVVNQTGYAGGGVLLDQFHVLTAAHKVYMNGGTPNMIGVYLGVYNPTQLGMRYTVARVFVHPNFNPSNLFNDLALLRLSTPVSPLPQQNVNTACLPTQGQTFVGQNCWVSGWGQTSFIANNAPTIQQRQVQVPIVAYGTCYASMSNVSLLGANVNTYLDPVGELCAGGQGLRDACTQDGGSPLVCNVNGRFTVAGLVIWGKGCGQQGVYGVYVNIANYVTWIVSSITMLNG